MQAALLGPCLSPPADAPAGRSEDRRRLRQLLDAGDVEPHPAALFEFEHFLAARDIPTELLQDRCGSLLSRSGSAYPAMYMRFRSRKRRHALTLWPPGGTDLRYSPSSRGSLDVFLHGLYGLFDWRLKSLSYSWRSGQCQQYPRTLHSGAKFHRKRVLGPHHHPQQPPRTERVVGGETA